MLPCAEYWLLRDGSGLWMFWCLQQCLADQKLQQYIISQCMVHSSSVGVRLCQRAISSV